MLNRLVRVNEAKAAGPESNDQGFTHVYQMTIEDEKAREVYLPHPERIEFVDMLTQLNILEDVFVVDYAPGE